MQKNDVIWKGSEVIVGECNLMSMKERYECEKCDVIVRGSEVIVGEWNLISKKVGCERKSAMSS